MSIHFPIQAAPIWTVAPKLGIDLATAIRDGEMTPEALGQMLRHCAECWNTKKCARWQQIASDFAPSEMPSFCASHEQLNAIAETDAPAMAHNVTRPDFRRSMHSAG